MTAKKKTAAPRKRKPKTPLVDPATLAPAPEIVMPPPRGFFSRLYAKLFSSDPLDQPEE